MSKSNLCGNCGQTLVTDECAFCGWTRNASAGSPDAPPMPTLPDALQVIASEIRQYRGQRPAGMPASPEDAARWMIAKVLEKHQPEEKPALVTFLKGKDSAQTWRWPYLTRIKIQTRQFLHLSPDYQRYIIAAKEDGIPWRGDEEWFFRKVVAEHQRMMEIGVDAYRKEAMAKMRGLLSATKRKSEAA